jgi:hypothetical protein
MGKANKTDALDAKGLAILLHNGTLTESWIPPGELRDRRELLRTRMALRDLRSSLKHRIHAAIDRYGLQATGISDLFGVKGRVYIDTVLDRLPCDTAAMIQVQLSSLNQLEAQIEVIEDRIAVALKPSPEVRLLRTVPGIGEILAPLVWLEIGDIGRFPRAENLAGYDGLVPRIVASGGRMRHGGTCRNVNQYFKWGLVEAATCAIRIQAYRGTHIDLLYHRLAPNKDTDAPSSLSPATLPRPVTGCRANSNPTSLQTRATRRPEPSSSSSAKRETRLTSYTGLGVNAKADSAQAHAGSHGEYMIHDETIRRVNQGRRTKPHEKRADKSIAQPAVVAMVSHHCAAERKSNSKNYLLDNMRFHT